MKQAFTMSHREVYNLFKAWGFIDGRKSTDGHKRMDYVKRGHTKLSPVIVHTVSIMEPGRPGTGERGNERAMRKAAKILGIGLQEFLRGPLPKPKTPPPTIEEQMAGVRRMQEGADKMTAERRQQRSQTAMEVLASKVGGIPAMPKTGEASNIQHMPDPYEKGKSMTNPSPTLPIVPRGISQAIQGFLAANKGKEFTVNEVYEHVQATGLDASKVSIGGTLTHLAHGPKTPDIVRVKRGVYMHTAKPVIKYGEPAKHTAAESPADPLLREDPRDPMPTQEQLDEVFGAPVNLNGGFTTTPPVQHPSHPSPSMNGNAPTLLSKVASLDGGKLLYQGDNQELYLVTVRHLQVD